MVLPRPGEDGQEPKERRRYVVCRNPAEARRDAASRAAMVADLETKLKSGAKALIGNRGYRRYLKTGDEGFQIDIDKVRAEEKFDGIWVLAPTPAHARGGAALQGTVAGRAGIPNRESLLDTRPIFHYATRPSRSRVLLVPGASLAEGAVPAHGGRGIEAEWADILRDLDALTEIEIENGGKRFLVRSRSKGATAAILRCAGARLPLTIRCIDEPAEGRENPAAA